MPHVRLPLSGDVTQAINPLTWFLKASTAQFGFFNINIGKSADPQLEEQILDEVGSYGRQLGQLGDALGVLLNHVDLDGLTPKEQKMIWAFRLQLDEINKLKEKRR